jgi:hypothetical protein
LVKYDKLGFYLFLRNLMLTIVLVEFVYKCIIQVIIRKKKLEILVEYEHIDRIGLFSSYLVFIICLESQ